MEHREGKERRLAGRDGWAGNYRKLQIFSLSSTKTRKKECSSNLKPSFSWSLIRIHESMTVIGLEFVWRHTAPLQMSLTCYLISLWGSYKFCWWGEGHHARLLLEAMLSRGAPLCCPQASFLLHDHVYNWVVGLSETRLSALWGMWLHRAGGTLWTWVWETCGGILVVEREKVGWEREENWGLVPWGQACKSCQVNPLSRRQRLPCSVGRVTPGFLSLWAFPMGFSVGRYDLCTISYQPCDSYITPRLVHLQMGFSRLLRSKDCLGVTENRNNLYWGTFWKRLFVE